MDHVDSLRVPIFQTTSLNTAIVPGILQFLVGTSSKSPFKTLCWAGHGEEELVLPSKMLLQMMALSHSSCVVGHFLPQCTLWAILFK